MIQMHSLEQSIESVDNIMMQMHSLEQETIAVLSAADPNMASHTELSFGTNKNILRKLVYGNVQKVYNRSVPSYLAGKVQLTATTYQLAVGHLTGAIDSQLALWWSRGSSDPIDMYLAHPRDFRDA
jgi:hypothetical protein